MTIKFTSGLWLKSCLRSHTVVTIILAICVVVAFAPLFKAGWVYDDVNLVKPSPALKNLSGLAQAISTDLYSQSGARLESSAYWRPLAMASYWLDTRFGSAPLALHAGNIVLHALAAMLLMLVLMRRHAGIAGIIAGGLAAAWWALHPQNVEVVAWISCRYEILTVLALLGLLALRWRQGWLHAALFGLVFLAGLLSKEGFGAMLAVVVAMDFARMHSLRDVSIRELAPRWVAIVVAVIIWLVLRSFIGLKGFAFPPFSAIIAIGFNYLEAIAIYFWRAFAFPPLTISHPLTSNSILGVIAGGFIFIGFAAAAIFLRSPNNLSSPNKELRPLAVPVAIFLAGLVPMAGAITMFSEVPERYFYLPSIGLALMVAELIAFALNKQQRVFRFTTPALFAALIIVGLMFVQQRLPEWKNDDALWSAALRVDPQDPNANYNLGIIAGRNGRWSEASRMIQIAAEGKPDSGRIANAYAWVLLESRYYTGAVREAKRATELSPYEPNSWYYLAFASHKMGDHKSELAAVEKLLEVAPNFPRAMEMQEVATCEVNGGGRNCLR